MASISPRWLPTQNRGPAPNGMCAYRGRFAGSSGSNRSGSNAVRVGPELRVPVQGVRADQHLRAGRHVVAADLVRRRPPCAVRIHTGGYSRMASCSTMFV